MTAQLINLDSRRPKVFEQMYCMFCCTQHALVHPKQTSQQQYFGPCPGCDEDASVPLARMHGATR